MRAKELSLRDDYPAFKRRPSWKSFDAIKAVEMRMNTPDRRDVNVWMRPDVQNLACHSGEEVQEKFNTFTFLSSSSSSITLFLFHYLHWLLHDHRSHSASVIIKERLALRARLGENLTAEYFGRSEDSGTTNGVCIKISQESIFTSILLK